MKKDQADYEAEEILNGNSECFLAEAIADTIRKRDLEIQDRAVGYNNAIAKIESLESRLDRYREEITRLKELHQHMLDGPLTTAQRECHQLRAELDAAVECLRWYADFDCEGTAGDEACNLGERASDCLARLPNADLHAQAQRDVIAAAREVDSDGHPGKDYSEILSRLSDALARLDALDGGGGE